MGSKWLWQEAMHLGETGGGGLGESCLWLEAADARLAHGKEMGGY